MDINDINLYELYIVIEKPFKKMRYMYFDTEYNMMHAEFDNLGIHYKKISSSDKPNSKYILNIIEMKNNVSNQLLFEYALQNLIERMPLTGHTDYVDYVFKHIIHVKELLFSAKM